MHLLVETLDAPTAELPAVPIPKATRQMSSGCVPIEPASAAAVDAAAAAAHALRLAFFAPMAVHLPKSFLVSAGCLLKRARQRPTSLMLLP